MIREDGPDSNLITHIKSISHDVHLLSQVDWITYDAESNEQVRKKDAIET